MKRYIFCLIVGGVLTVSGQFALSLSVHPDRAVGVDPDRVTTRSDGLTVPGRSLAPLLQGCLALVLGSVLTVSAMLGLADGYQREACKLSKLLDSKIPVDSDQDLGAAPNLLAVSSNQDLQRYNQGFWHAYLKTAAALCMFMAGTLALTTVIVDTSFFLYLIILTSGTGVTALVAAVVGLPGLQFLRRAHAEVANAADIYADQPDLPVEEPVPAVRPPRRPWRLPRRRPMDQVARQVNLGGHSSQVTVRHYD